MRTASTTPIAAAVAAVAAAMAAFAFAGCGGPEVHLGRGVVGTPEGDYERAAGEICEEVARRFAQVQAEPPRTFDQGRDVVDSLLGIAREGEEQLASIDAPDDRADAFADYLDARADVIAELERAADAADAEDGEAYERARDAAIEGAKERAELAERAGLAGCARVERG